MCCYNFISGCITTNLCVKPTQVVLKQPSQCVLQYCYIYLLKHPKMVSLPPWACCYNVTSGCIVTQSCVKIRLHCVARPHQNVLHYHLKVCCNSIPTVRKTTQSVLQYSSLQSKRKHICRGVISLQNIYSFYVQAPALYWFIGCVLPLLAKVMRT